MYNGSLPQATNRQSWSEVFELIDAETGEADDISDADDITFAVRRKGCTSPQLTLSLGDGVTLVDEGTNGAFQVDVTVEQMRALCAPQTYDVGITILLQGETIQLFEGTWPIRDGVVS
jgi:hypothetical protein